MIPVTCSLVEPGVDAANTLLAAITLFLGPLGLTTILNPLSNLLGWVRALAGCP